VTLAVQDATRPSHASRTADRSRARTTAIVLGGWCVAVVVVRLWGLAVVHAAHGSLFVGAVPFFGRWQLAWSLRSLVALALGGAGVALLPNIATRWSWRHVLVALALTTVAFCAALSFAKPADTSWGSIHDDYGRHVDLVADSPGGFLRDYVDRQATFPTHLQAHPPGLVLLLWSAGEVGLRGLGFENALALGGAAAAAVAAVVMLRAVTGADAARRATPFVALAPAAVWHTNADTLYGGLALSGLALIVVATTRDDGKWRAAAVGGGLLFGAALLGTYGVVALAIVPAVVGRSRQRYRPLLVAGVAACALLLAPALWGFSWLAGLETTKQQYDLNLARVRPYSYFVIANLVVFAIAVGPAVAVALTRLRDRGTWLLVGAGLAVVALADVSGLALAETERIWQPFMPLVLLAGAALPARGATADRRWLGLQVAVALGLQLSLRSPW
jgi:hypothetical protein